tara:strand:- start:5319 stop:5612 length:294 start_codon:yes stop_codon:yes gene_type:complete
VKKNMNKKLVCNANAMHPLQVLTDKRCFSIWAAYALFSAMLCGWLLIEAAGWKVSASIVALHLAFFMVLKPASAGGRMVAEAKAPATSQKGTNLLRN